MTGGEDWSALKAIAVHPAKPEVGSSLLLSPVDLVQLTMFLHADRLQLLDIVLMEKLPLVVADLLNLAPTVLQAIACDPFTKIEDALQNLLKFFSSRIIL